MLAVPLLLALIMYVNLFSPTGQMTGNYGSSFDGMVGYGGQCDLSPLTKATFKFNDKTTTTFTNSNPLHPQTFSAFDKNKVIIGLIIEAAAPAPPSAEEIEAGVKKAARKKQEEFEKTLQQQRQSDTSQRLKSNMGKALVMIALVAVCVIALRRRH